MRQSKESGNDSDREADKSGAAIEYALVELNKDIGWLGGMIGQFANKKSLAGSYRLKKYFRRSCKFPESSSDRALPTASLDADCVSSTLALLSSKIAALWSSGWH